MKRAQVYARGTSALINPVSSNDGYVWFVHGPFRAIDLDDMDDAALGEHLLDALASSREYAEWPTRDALRRAEREQWRGLKARSRRGFASGTKYVGVADDNLRISLTPSRFVGPPIGWEQLPEQLKVGRSADVVGRAVRETLARSMAAPD